MTNVGHASTDCHANQPPLIAVLRPVTCPCGCSFPATRIDVKLQLKELRKGRLRAPLFEHPAYVAQRFEGNLEGLAAYLVEAPVNPGCQRILALSSLVKDCGLTGRFVRDRMQNNILTEQPLRFWLMHACRYKKPIGPIVRMIVDQVKPATDSDVGELL